MSKLGMRRNLFVGFALLLGIGELWALHRARWRDIVTRRFSWLCAAMQ